MYGSGCTSMPRQCSSTRFVQEAVGAVAQVGDFQPVGQDVVAVVAHQRVGVEDHRADAAHDHQAQSDRLLMNGWLGVFHQTNVAMAAMISST